MSAATVPYPPQRFMSALDCRSRKGKAMKEAEMFALDAALKQQERKDELLTLRRVLHKIGYEPFGAADATHAEVLEAITEYARAAIAAAEAAELKEASRQAVAQITRVLNAK